MDLYHNKSKRKLILKGRKQGVTTFKEILILDRVIFTPNYSGVIVAHTREDVQRLFRIAKTAFERFPDNLKPHTKYDNVNELYFDEQNSSFYVALQVRGGSPDHIHFSEASWTQNFEQKLTASQESLSSTGEITAETTANGIGEPFQRMYTAAENGDNEWTPLFYGWNWGDQNRMPDDGQEPTEHEKDLIEKYRLDNEQLSWRRRKLRTMVSVDMFNQEHPISPEVAFISTGGNRFDVEMLKSIMGSLPPTLSKEDISEHDSFKDWQYADHLSIWQLPKPGVRYVMGTDCAEGMQTGDWSVTCVLDPSTGKQVAELRGQIPIERFTDLSMALGKAYNDALWAIEADMGYGHTAITRAKTIYKNLFRRSVSDGASVSERKVKKYGWSTNGHTKPAMITGLDEALYKGFIKVGSKVLISECMTYKEEDGKMNAASGCHDDTIIAAAIAWEMRKHIRKKSRVHMRT